MDKKEPNLNPAVVEALSGILDVDRGHVIQKAWPRPITNGYYIRRMFIEAFLFVGGTSMSMERGDIQEHGHLSDKEWDTVLTEYMDKGVVLKVSNPFGADLYKLDMKEVAPL